jgi:hypothetical protein
MVMLAGQWHIGYPGSQGELVVDGEAEGAFCRQCAAYFLGELSIDLNESASI